MTRREEKDRYLHLLAFMLISITGFRITWSMSS